MPSIDSASSQPISGFSGLPKFRQSVKPIGSPPTQATLRAASRTATAPPVKGSSDPMRPVPSGTDGKSTPRRSQTRTPLRRDPDGGRYATARAGRNGGRRTRASAGQVGEQLAQRGRGRWRTHDRHLGARRPGLPLDLVPGALVREQPCRDLPDRIVVPESTQETGFGHLAYDGVVQLPARADLLDLGEVFRCHDRDHPLLRFGDHHLPRLHALLAQRHAIEVDVDAVFGGHLGERRRETGGTTVLERLHETALDQLDRDLDQLLARERVSHLDRRPFVGVVLSELGAGQHRCAADPVPARGCAVEHDERAGGRRLRAHQPRARKQPDAHRVDEAVRRVGLVEDDLAADGGHANRVPVGTDTADGTGEPVRPVRRTEARRAAPPVAPPSPRCRAGFRPHPSPLPGTAPRQRGGCGSPP